MQAIPANYKGVKFRSRREARWAVFFDTLGIQWLYEPEGYDLGEMVYLPDFWLPEFDCFWEVKAPGGGGEEKCERLVKLTRKAVYIHFGEVALNQLFANSRVPGGAYEVEFGESLYDRSDSARKFWSDGMDNFYLWCECPECGLLGLQFEGRAIRLHCDCTPSAEEHPDWYNPFSSRILIAYHTAQRYRFW